MPIASDDRVDPLASQRAASSQGDGVAAALGDPRRLLPSLRKPPTLVARWSPTMGPGACLLATLAADG